jgi:chitinase
VPLARRLASRPSLAILVTLAVAGITVFAAGNRPPPSPIPSARPTSSPVEAASPLAALPSVRPIPGHELYAFVPYWEIDATIAAHIRGSDVSTVALFSVTSTSKGAIDTKQNGYRRVTGPIGRRIVADAHARDRRVDVTYTSFGADRNAALFGDPALQDRVIASIVDVTTSLRVDGVAVDVEQIDDVDVPAYASFIGRLRTALRARDRDATVTVATTPGAQGAAIAAAVNLAGADRIFLMGYDYRTAAGQPGASSPLDRTDGDPRTLSWSLDLYAALGVPSTRLLLGLPLYGVAWPVVSPDLGAPATGKGSVWIPRQNLATLRSRTATPLIDPIEGVAFLAVPDGSGWQGIYYDTPATLAPKLALADDRGLAGAGLWALGYDRGLPGYGALLGDFRAGRLTPSAEGSAAP